MKKFGVIYKIENKITGEVYIGQTTQSFDERYKYGLYKGASNKYFKTSIRRYGVQNFSIEKEFCIAHDRVDLDTKERAYIKQYSSNIKGMGYNIDQGGNRRRKVIQLDKNNNYVNEFNSIADAYTETGILDFEISQCCRGIKQEVDGYKFIYKD